MQQKPKIAESYQTQSFMAATSEVGPQPKVLGGLLVGSVLDCQQSSDDENQTNWLKTVTRFENFVLASFKRYFVIGVDVWAGVESALRRCCLVTSPRLPLVLCTN